MSETLINLFRIFNKKFSVEKVMKLQNAEKQSQTPSERKIPLEINFSPYLNRLLCNLQQKFFMKKIVYLVHGNYFRLISWRMHGSFTSRPLIIRVISFRRINYNTSSGNCFGVCFQKTIESYRTTHIEC